jgi:hypothetical protein
LQTKVEKREGYGATHFHGQRCKPTPAGREGRRTCVGYDLDSGAIIHVRVGEQLCSMVRGYHERTVLQALAGYSDSPAFGNYGVPVSSVWIG